MFRINALSPCPHVSVQKASNTDKWKECGHSIEIWIQYHIGQSEGLASKNAFHSGGEIVLKNFYKLKKEKTTMAFSHTT